MTQYEILVSGQTFQISFDGVINGPDGLYKDLLNDLCKGFRYLSPLAHPGVGYEVAKALSTMDGVQVKYVGKDVQGRIY